MTVKERPSIWTVISVITTIGLASMLVGDRFWGSKPDSNVTAYQVTQLTQAVRDLADKFGGLAKQTSVDALSTKVGSLDSDMTGAQHDIKGLRSDVDGILHPQFRNTRCPTC